MYREEVEKIIKIINTAANVTLGFGIFVLCITLLVACSVTGQSQGALASTGTTMTVTGLIVFVVSGISWAFIKAVAYIVEFLAIQTDTMLEICKTVGGDMDNLESGKGREDYSNNSLPPIN